MRGGMTMLHAGRGWNGLALGAALLLARPLSAQATLQFIAGSVPTEQFGSCVAAAGDIDGDGRGGILAGAPPLRPPLRRVALGGTRPVPLPPAGGPATHGFPQPV